MRAGLRAPFVDTRAADLTWTLDHPPIEPLATRTVRVGAARVELRVLGASHQVRAETHGGGPGRLLETVACLPGEEGALPRRTAAQVPAAAEYLFTSTVEVLTPGELGARVSHLTREVDEHPNGLLATFPGDPLAVTAMAVTAPGRRAPLGWRTWHSYPQSGELVTTTTSVALRQTHSATRGRAHG
ncbi:hypothetical protein F4561_000365 [Lipingzhangella halophila]|uniref:DUF2617 family protein n=1 Tax=Lipingzhangella halophila TaxID=1783352 RepID=A0A7W7RCL9_9ACTN|nr:DUF2617 family protein [Lipingzhangella halophila]MBB4929545.1 hypothetical protein [Lipingzhangella halophila]